MTTTAPTPPLLRFSEAVRLMESMGIRGAKHKLPVLVQTGRVATIHLHGRARAYYFRDTILAIADPHEQSA